MGCQSAPEPSEAPLEGTLVVFHAGSLAVPLAKVSEAFRELYPGVKVERESAGSRTTIRKVTELGKPADIVASSDYSAIEEMMFPDFADWYLAFARNEMVIAYTEISRYHAELNQDNWYDLLTREGVDYGRSDPNADPAGYRALMVWQLAEEHYRKPGLYSQLWDNFDKRNLRPKESELVPLLQAGELDYAFFYRSLAQQHNLGFLELPPEINLSSPEFQELYARAKVEVSGAKPGEKVVKTGGPIIYAVTIPRNPPHPRVAIAFLEFLLGEKGQAIMEGEGQPPIAPALTKNLERIPEELRGYAAPWTTRP